jgi:hypothetical protein
MSEEEPPPRPSLRDSFFGDKEKYDYSALCMPNLPFFPKPKQQINFYGKGMCSSHEGEGMIDLGVIYSLAYPILSHYCLR